MDTATKNSEWRFLEACEQDAHTSIAAKERFLELIPLLPSIPRSRTILDIGGSLGTARWLSRKFPGARVTIINTSREESKRWRYSRTADAQNFTVSPPVDCVFCGETLEHLYNPDGFLYCAFNALKIHGTLIITTPNLACLPNRLFLLMGWMPGNYSASLRFNTGNPLLNLKTENFGVIGDHKTVFTYGGLSELLTIHGFSVTATRGYSYSQPSPVRALNDQSYTIPHSSIRTFANRLTPHRLREGMLFIAEKTSKTSPVRNAIFRGRLWG